MAEILKIDQDAVFGKCFRLWAWADQQTIDGVNLEIQGTYIDRLTFCPGFADALRKVGWLVGRNGRLMIPNFDRHNGQSAKSRSLAKDRQEETRDTRKIEAVSKVGSIADLTPKQRGGRESVIPRGIRVTVYARDGFRCCYCGWRKSDPQPLAGKFVGLMKLSLDHITPFCQGGTDEMDNLVTACLACNMRKSGRTPEDAGMRIAYGPMSDRDNSVTNHVIEKRREEKRRLKIKNTLTGVDASNLPLGFPDPSNLGETAERIKRVKGTKTTIPADWVIPAEVLAWCLEKNLPEPDFQLPMFINHFQSKGEARADWVATFRNWMLSPYRKDRTHGNRPGHVDQRKHEKDSREFTEKLSL